MRSPQAVDFVKYSATGNDFILIDNRRLEIATTDAAFFRRICERRKSVGADGVLLIEDSRNCDFKLRYINADGSEAECGNGARAAAHYACNHEIAGRTMRFEFGQHIYEATVNGDMVRVQMPRPFDYREHTGVVEEPFLREGGFINTGVPHLVVFCEQLEKVDVTTIGRKYRNHTYFKPEATNVDFVHIESQDVLRVRTYERGVEAETLSCGTGCVAAAVIAHLKKETALPVTIHTSGGVLTVEKTAPGDSYFLAGAVHAVYRATLL